MNIRIFYAHSSFDSIDRVEEACKRIRAIFRAKRACGEGDEDFYRPRTR